MKQLTDKSLQIVVVAILVFVGYHTTKTFIVNPINFEKDFREYEIVEGTFESLGTYNSIGREAPIKYSYSYKGNKKTLDLHRDIPCDRSLITSSEVSEKLFAYRFPVAVSKTSLRPYPLISLNDFRRFNKKMPDSLWGTYDLYLNCAN